MFTSPRLAADIDRAEGRLCAGIAHAAASDTACRSTVMDIGGGVAVFAGAGSPTNKMIGAGFEDAPQDHELSAVEEAFTARGASLQAEVATLADPAFHSTLVRRGYEPRGFENVLGRGLGQHLAPPSPEIDVSVVAAAELDAWVDLVVAGFATPDTGGVGGDALPESDELRRWMRLTTGVPGFVCVAARLGGRLAGGAALRVDGHILQLCGAATLPGFRRRGVQTALLRWRLAHAASLGCDLAVVTTQPASKSQENVQREGFQLLYARQLLLKEFRS